MLPVQLSRFVMNKISSTRTTQIRNMQVKRNSDNTSGRHSGMPQKFGNCGSWKRLKKKMRDRIGCLTLVHFTAATFHIYLQKKDKQANEVPNLLASEFNTGKCSALEIQCCKTSFNWNVKFVFDLTDSTAHFSVTVERNKSWQHSDKMYIWCPSNSAEATKGDTPPWKWHKNMADRSAQRSSQWFNNTTSWSTRLPFTHFWTCKLHMQIQFFWWSVTDIN